jgi:hypothetical protein
MKFVAQSSGLGVAEKTTRVGVKICKKRMSSTFARGSDMTPALTRALDLFDLGSSASDGETTPPVLP